jgi:opacity protein-like surface antigen
MTLLQNLKNTFGAFLAVTVVLLLGVSTASAQVENPSRISIQGIGMFTKGSDGNGIRQEASKSSGFLAGYSYQFNRWASVEGNYGYSRNTQNFIATAGTTGIQSNVHQFTGAFVAHLPVYSSRVEPYALAGTGALMFDPTDNNAVAGAERQSKAVFLYGGGVNWGLTSKIGLRTEYRGFIYQTPDFGISSLNLDKVTHLAQPSAGLYFRF